MDKLMAAIAAFLAFQSSGVATTVVGISTEDRVLIGADSKTGRDGINSAGTTCKIVWTRNFVSAAAGLLGDQATGLNIKTQLLEALRGPGDLLVKVQTFERLVRPALETSLDFGRKNAFPAYASGFLGKKVLQTIFAGLENGEPKK